MNAIAVLDRAEIVDAIVPPAADFADWMSQGRDLFAQRRGIDWAIGDWARQGRERFRDDPQFKLMLEGMGVEPKRVDHAAKVAEAFPPHLRAGGVSFEVHAKLATVDADQRLAFVRQADDEHWTPKRAHHAVVEWKHEQGHLLDEDDDTTRQAVEVIRAWNRACPEARAYFFDLAKRAHLEPIDEDKAYD